MSEPSGDREVGDRFPLTSNTLVECLRSENEEVRARAWETLATVYWRPLYKYVRLKWNRNADNAEDLTQSFLAFVFEKRALESFDPGKARFRTFIRTLFDRFLANEWKAASREKRGGGAVHYDFATAEAELRGISSDEVPADELLRREWVRSVMGLAISRLEAELAQEGKTSHLEIFRAYDLEQSASSYREVAEALSLPVTTVTNHLASARRRFRELVLDCVRELTANEEEYREEVRSLLGVGR